MKKNRESVKWRIIEMEHWDKDYIDLVVPGHITFDKDGCGGLQFGIAHGFLDCRIEQYSGFERIEFSWEGESGNGVVYIIIISLSIAWINRRLEWAQRKVRS